MSRSFESLLARDLRGLTVFVFFLLTTIQSSCAGSFRLRGLVEVGRLSLDDCNELSRCQFRKLKFWPPCGRSCLRLVGAFVLTSLSVELQSGSCIASACGSLAATAGFTAENVRLCTGYCEYGCTGSAEYRVPAPESRLDVSWWSVTDPEWLRGSNTLLGRMLMIEVA